MNVTEEWTCYHCRETVQLPTSPTLTSILIDEHAATCQAAIADTDAEFRQLLHTAEIERTMHRCRITGTCLLIALVWVAAIWRLLA
jgi:hypothetical protein